LLKAGETVPASWGSGEASAPAEAPKEEAVAVGATASASSAPAAPAPAGRVKVSPLAKRIAEEAGLDLNAIAGSGPGGRIVEKDVKAAIASGPRVSAPSPASAAPAPPAPVVATGADQVVTLNRLRQIIAQRTQHAKQTVPHFYVTVEVDVEAIMDLRAQFEAQGAGKVSVNDFVVKASALALAEMPEVNATFQGDKVIRHGSINVGIAAAIEDGLLVPVIHGAQNMSLRQLSSKAKELVAKAREGRLLPDEMGGSTFSISNMGMLDVDNFTAIINEPNAAIVAVSSARKKPIVTAEDELEIRMRMNLTGSFDHRVLDGAVGAKFMNVLRGYLENPTRLLS
jgi:pyruvate dehydrogenase E2 component (dihydrolipoamide acetyltransferase)